jgi:Ca2+:H+ antiporter
VIAGVSRRQGAGLGAVAIVALATAALELGDAEPVVIFAVSAVALAGLAWVVSFATEGVAQHFGPAVTGVLQASLGNLPELFIVLFALSAGEVVVAQFSILGSLFANALLVLGLVIVTGAWRAEDGVMRFAPRLANDTATLLLLAVFIIVLLGASDQVGDRASSHLVTISAVGAVVLLVVYAAFLAAYLRGKAPRAEEPSGVGRMTLGVGIGLLAVSGIAAAFVSDWFVGALDPAIDELGISRAFTGLVIVGIAGNAVEHAVGVVLAAKGQSDLAISVVKNSVSQIAAFLWPALVLLSLFFDDRLTFVLAPVYIGALAIMAISVWQVTGDGEAAVFEGAALVGLYLVLATLAWFE